MTDSRRWIWFIVCLLSVILLGRTAAPTAAQPEQQLDVVLLIDNSGSMEANDPAGLRWSAAQLFVDLADDGDRVAAFAFANEVQPLSDAAEEQLTPIQGYESRRTLKEAFAPRAPEGATNMEAAVRAALTLLREDAGGNRPIVVFLTDGRPEPESQRPALEALIQEAGREGIPVFPILLGTDTDARVADQMVRDTGGLRQDVRNAAGLLRAFGKIYTFIRPDRYADELASSGGRITFRTNPAQAVTQLSIVIPRANATVPAITALTHDGTELLDREQLSSGARLTEAEAPHYQLMTITHNAPLAGEWAIATGTAAAQGLLIARSAITLELIHPVPSVADSFVSPRVVPAGKPVFLVARALQNGNRMGDVPLSVVTVAGQTLPLSSEGLSPNRDLFWRVLRREGVSDAPAGERRRIELQVGGELSPFRLRKEFVVETADVPPLVFDSPTEADSGLQAGGTLRIAAHFEGDAVSAPEMIVGPRAMTAYVRNDRDGEITVLDLQCQQRTCADESFQPDPGRSYHIVILGRATYQDRPFSDAGETELVTENIIRVDGLEEALELPALPPGRRPSAIPLTITAFLRSGRPRLEARLTELHPRPAGVSAEGVGVILTPPTAEGGNTYTAELQFLGFDRLPPGEYTAVLSLTTPEATVQPASVPVRFTVVRPRARLTGLRAPLEFGEIPDLRAPQRITVGVTYEQSEPFALDATVTSLASEAGPMPPDRLQVDLGRPLSDRDTVSLRLSALQPVAPGRYRGVIEFRPAEEGTYASVEPDEVAFVFTIPRPRLALTHIEPPTEPAGCRSTAGEVVDFGAIPTTARPIEVNLTFEGAWVRERPDLHPEIISLRRVGTPGVGSQSVQIQTGPVRRIETRNYALPLRLELPPDHQSGTYEGELRLIGTDVAVQPERLPFRFDVRTTLPGRIRHRLQPVYCMLIDWYGLTPFPRFKGIVGWLSTLLILLFVYALGRQAQTGGVEGLVRPAGSGTPERFSVYQSVYVVRDATTGSVQLSVDDADADRALLEIIAEPADDVAYDVPVEDLEDEMQETALVQPGAGAGMARLGSRTTEQRGWYQIPVGGVQLHHMDRILVQIDAERYEFTILFE